jgi:alpha-L-fucosidase
MVLRSTLTAGVLCLLLGWGCAAHSDNASLRAVARKPAAAPEREAVSQPTARSWPAASPEAIKRWQDLRFGMFIHWGPVTLEGTEIGWSRGTKKVPIEVYDNLYKRFDPEQFNADQWVSIAKAAGMKYIVLTTKHHDGFCLWDTQYTDYNIMHTPFHRDVVKELSAACKKQGIAFGCYYSVTDWYNPDWPLTSPGGKVKRAKSDMDAYEKYLQNQIRELITNYGPLITIWNDVPGPFGVRGADTIKMVRALQPDILINNRTGDGGDYLTPEQKIGGFNNDQPWETCMTLCRQWAWKPNDQMKSLKKCLQTLIACAGGDGNLLLNVGPNSQGIIEARQVDRLKEIGAWMDQYGASIYRTRGGPWMPTESVASTRAGNVIYLHVMNWDKETLTLPPIPRKIIASSVMTGGTVNIVQTDQQLTLSVPKENRQDIDTLIKLELDGSAMDTTPIPMQKSTTRPMKVKP